MNTLKEVPPRDAITHAIEVLKCCFDHPEADEAIAGLSLLLEQAKWAHHTPKLLSDADAAADLAGVARPGAEPYAYAVYFPYEPREELVHKLDDLLDDLTNCTHGITPLYTTPPQASQPERYIVPEFIPIAQRKLNSLLADGYQVTGYSIERTRDDIVQRGAVTCGGMVLWWHGNSQPAPDAVDAERYRWLRDRFLAADYAWGDPTTCVWVFETSAPVSADLGASIDAAIAAQKGQP